jgi:hypothetical protein
MPEMVESGIKESIPNTWGRNGKEDAERKIG